MVLADDLAYLMDGKKVFCVDRAEHAKASQEKQKWFLRAREDRGDTGQIEGSRREYGEICQGLEFSGSTKVNSMTL